MAQTDARPGFRLPWNSEQRLAEDAGDGVDVSAPGASAAPASAPAAAAPPATAPKATGSGRSSKFLADLTRAMSTAAQAARDETLVRLQADAKAHVEEIHARSSTEAADLRRRADDDVAEIREWSKAEIARIREETETRISTRKGHLETEIDEHAALIERQIERVRVRVAAFEQEMSDFFEQLLAEEDPTRFASLAGNLPEPPPFDDDPAAAAAAAFAASPDASTDVDPWTGNGLATADAAAKTSMEVTAQAPAVADDVVDDIASLRLAALGSATDFDAAEAEAFAAAQSVSDEDEIPTLGDEAVAARLAGLAGSDESPAETTTQVVVVGLVSVASIAAFKRSLSRLAGVHSVGVSSGPEGEFLFGVTHGPSVDLRTAIPNLSGFNAQIAGGSGDVVEVVANDPDAEA